MGTVARLVRKDMVESSDLTAQQKRTGLGALLRRPWPISRLDATETGRPALSADLLPFVGSCRSYTDAMASTNTNSAQQRHVVVVVQASGAGKTRLAVADGLSTRLVVIVRVYKQTQNFAPGWNTYISLSKHWESVLDVALDEDRRTVSQFAMAALRLLVGCYVSYVASIIGAIAEDRPAPLRADDVSARDRREVALRCLRNGRGDSAVGQLFLLQLANMTTTVEMSDASHSSACVRVVAVDFSAVNAFCRDADTRLRGLLWPDADVAIWFDEVDSLFNTPKVFAPFGLFNRHECVPPSQRQDVFYGLVALTGNLLDEFKWLQTLCGSWLEINRRIELPEISPLRGRATAVFHASNIGVADMLSTLRSYLEIDASCEAALLPILEILRGRPILFFDDMLYSLWTALSSQWVLGEQVAIHAASLQIMLIEAAQQGVIRGTSRMSSLVKKLWDPESSVRISARQSTESLCVELYVAARLSGGRFVLQNDTGGEALQRGLLALPLQRDNGSVSQLAGLEVKLDNEPLSRDALLIYGDALVQEQSEDADPVFALLCDSMSNGRIAGFRFTRSVKGETLELAFVWHVIRSVLRANLMPGSAAIASVRGLSLDELLVPLSPRDFEMPARAASVFVTSLQGLSCANVSGASPPTHLHLLVDKKTQNCVLYEIEKNAGPDVAFMVVDSDLKLASVVDTQAKARISASLRDSLRAASPAWHFLSEPARDAAFRGEPYEPKGEEGAKRKAFENLAAGPCSALFSSAFRIALSVAGFSPKVAAAISELNRLDEGTRSSPIVLCEPSAAAFGSQLYRKLIASCVGGPTTSGTTELAFLLPQSAASVSAGSVVRVAATSALADVLHIERPRAGAAEAK
jgi:hypothetical protein